MNDLDVESLAYLMAIVVAKIAPQVDANEAYDLLYEFFTEDMDEVRAALYGELIRATAAQASKGIH